MIIYKCDKCGKTFDWYESFYYNKKFNNMGHKEMQQWEKENPDANYWESDRASFGANALKFVSFSPINDNMTTNNGKLSADIEDVTRGNNPLIILCQDCMTDFTRSLQEWWDSL